MQKNMDGPSASCTYCILHLVINQAMEESEAEEEVEEIQEMPKLKSDILAGLVDHMKGLKKEDLENLYKKNSLRLKKMKKTRMMKTKKKKWRVKKVAKESI